MSTQAVAVCPRCGAQNAADAEICHRCMASLAWPSTSSIAETMMPAPKTAAQPASAGAERLCPTCRQAVPAWRSTCEHCKTAMPSSQASVPDKAAEQAVKGAIVAVFWMGCGNTLFGILSVSGVLGPSMNSPLNLVFGLALVGLGVLVLRRQRSALAIAIGLAGVGLLLNVVGICGAISSGGFPLGIGSTFMIVMLMSLMVKGYNAM
jgi:hypothetical protein